MHGKSTILRINGNKYGSDAEFPLTVVLSPKGRGMGSYNKKMHGINFL